MTHSIDINCDMGEEMPNDALLMPLISSANIACGAHAGNRATMRKTIELALQHGVAIGAHPSFPDRENFGRTQMQLPPVAIYDLVQRQLALLANEAAAYGASLHHVKPHGALYNMAVKDAAIAEAIARAIASFDTQLILYGMGELIANAQPLKTCHEVFADRTYQEDGSLTPRQQPNALIDSPEAVKKHLGQMLERQTVTATNGNEIHLKPETICIHGDGVHAVAFASMVRNLLQSHNIHILAP